ncbi:Fungal specific transcription factor domain [Geosmithia morbida]|uniref:Fungal specific transcription factor domain n=1 Tax=Geosmithia morbida TaxID=1094350 RepID=A0A9P4Z2G0_9HYPO|nr:Fungal specific transcription factor domain [Geosmithia morbida]KAF4126475.1 Fungal specific transcription factor domain [Geosmithia morbida]
METPAIYSTSSPNVPPRAVSHSNKQLMKAYFDYQDPTMCRFLHASTTLRDWGRQKLDPSLQRAICAFGLSLQDSSEQAHATASAWIVQAQEFVLGRLNSLSLSRLQALVLIISFRLRSGQGILAWNLLSLAARLAFTLRLNHEREDLGCILQESRRRTMWAIYAMDRRLCGGLRDLSVCPIESMQRLRLPCLERTFERGMPSRAQFLESKSTTVTESTEPVEGTSADTAADMDIMAYILRFYATRHRILAYTKGVLGDNVSPALSRDKFEALERELDTFQTSLPLDLQLSSERLELMAHSRDASGYFLLHAVWLQGYCDLYRLLVPGVREAVGPDVLAATPPDFLLHCQRRCLFRAVQMVDMWHLVSRLREEQSVDEAFFASCVYQLKSVMRLASPAIYERFPALGECLTEAGRLIERLGQIDNDMEIPGEPSTANSPMRQQRNRHMTSKGSYIPRDLSDDSDGGPEVHDPEGSRVPSTGRDQLTPHTRLGTHNSSVTPVDAANSAIPATAAEFGAESTMLYPNDFPDDLFLPLDSIHPQINDDYTGELGDYGFIFNMFTMP